MSTEFMSHATTTSSSSSVRLKRISKRFNQEVVFKIISTAVFDLIGFLIEKKIA